MGARMSRTRAPRIAAAAPIAVHTGPWFSTPIPIARWPLATISTPPEVRPVIRPISIAVTAAIRQRRRMAAITGSVTTGPSSGQNDSAVAAKPDPASPSRPTMPTMA